MTALRLKLRSEPAGRVDMSGVVPHVLAGLSELEMGSLPLGSGETAPKLGDLFTVAVNGTAIDGFNEIRIEGGSDRLDFVGAGLKGGRITIEGDVGAYAGHKMRGGRLEIGGSAGVLCASSLRGGLMHVGGSVGDRLGAPGPADRDGVMGGIVVVEGDAGDMAGERMRRGTMIVKGRIGASAAARMMGGTIWTLKGFGDAPGALLKRGTLITPQVARLLPTFVDCGSHRLLIVYIMMRYLKASLGDLMPVPVEGPVRRLMGDVASIGKGEILLVG